MRKKQPMTTAVTRSEFRTGMKELRTELRSEMKQLRDELRLELASKADLQNLSTALLIRMDTMVAVIRDELKELVVSLGNELGRHVRASQESFTAQIAAVHDKYADLPARVSHLEASITRP